ncbi:MAG: acyl-ACP--UDP-N-acetylglucosamine O-acyltransferase [Gammaproteobacteria bacterium]|nr:acyl-ACP--UDP-N-acetylglucosamine O-acyltransferase [Gammaproteobacteria bacterium]
MPTKQARIHPTAMIADHVELGKNVNIGPYVVIEDEVAIGDGSTIGPHSVIHSYTRIGAGNRIHAHVVLGDAPQHTAFKPGTVSRLEIGDDNDIREMVTMHRGLHPDAVTRVGSNCLIMANAHVGHDGLVGNHVIITNNAALAGHVELGDYVVVGGVVGIHQFVRIGPYAMVAAFSMVRKDVLPYCLAGGAEGAVHYRLNTIGLRRNGVSGECYKSLEKAYRLLRNGSRQVTADTEETRYLQQWLALPSKRGLAGFYRGSKPAE